MGSKPNIFILALWLLGYSSWSLGAAKPNVVTIMVDDLDYELFERLLGDKMLPNIQRAMGL